MLTGPMVVSVSQQALLLRDHYLERLALGGLSVPHGLAVYTALHAIRFCSRNSTSPAPSALAFLAHVVSDASSQLGNDTRNTLHLFLHE